MFEVMRVFICQISGQRTDQQEEEREKEKYWKDNGIRHGMGSQRELGSFAGRRAASLFCSAHLDAAQTRFDVNNHFTFGGVEVDGFVNAFSHPIEFVVVKGEM